MKPFICVFITFITMCIALSAFAISGAELYTNDAYTYGKFEARVRFGAGDGIVSSFFLWKPDSELDYVYWNELDLEKITDDCDGYATNIHWGLGSGKSDESEWIDADSSLCDEYHLHAFEWTPDEIAFYLDGIKIREVTGEAVAGFVENAQDGMQFRFNIWVGNESFGGSFDDASLPVYQYIDWVQYSEYTPGGGDAGSDFTLDWREDFESMPKGWSVGTWDSALGLSTHVEQNVNICSGAAVLSLTDDDATGPPDDCDVNGGDADVDADGDADTDSDVDSDGDGDTETDSDTEDDSDSDSDNGNSDDLKEADDGNCGCRLPTVSRPLHSLWQLLTGLM